MAKYEVIDGVGVIPTGATKIDDYAFQGCENLISVIVPDSVTEIGRWAFVGCNNLTKVTIPNGLTEIEWGVFSGCSSLASITIPDSVTYISGRAFEGCSNLESISIGSNVRNIRREAFNGCTSLRRIVVAEGNPEYDSRNNCNAIIDTKTNNLVIGCAGTIIPNSVARIEERAFAGCVNLLDITIPQSVSSIGVDAFEGCTSLKSITVSESNPKYDSRNNCNAIIETQHDELILGCDTTIIPYGVKNIWHGKALKLAKSPYTSLAINTAYALGNCLIGFLAHSWWFITAGAYYTVLAITRFSVLQIKRKAGGNYDVELFARRITGILLIALSICIVGVNIMSAVKDRGTAFHEIIMITIATYTFTKITSAIVGMVKAKHAVSAVVKTLRNISLADALCR